MTPKQLVKVRAELRAILLHPANRRAAELQALARAAGRVLVKRGKEPTWVREKDPALSPPLSIPDHSTDMKVGTVKSIVNQLLDDCDEWEIYQLTAKDDDHE